jgi:hypothetical protein
MLSRNVIRMIDDLLPPSRKISNPLNTSSSSAHFSSPYATGPPPESRGADRSNVLGLSREGIIPYVKKESGDASGEVGHPIESLSSASQWIPAKTSHQGMHGPGVVGISSSPPVLSSSLGHAGMPRGSRQSAAVGEGFIASPDKLDLERIILANHPHDSPDAIPDQDVDEVIILTTGSVVEQISSREECAHLACVQGRPQQALKALAFTLPPRQQQSKPRPARPGQWPVYQQEEAWDDEEEVEAGRPGPMHEAAALGSVSILSFLLHQAGGDVNEETQGRNRPLHYACFEGNVEAVEFLLASGADASAKNVQGWTAFELAEWGWGRSAAHRLRQHRLDTSFQMLGVRSDASPQQLRARFRKLSRSILLAMGEGGGVGGGGGGVGGALVEVCEAYLCVICEGGDPARGAGSRRGVEWAKLFCRLEAYDAEKYTDWVFGSCLPESRLKSLSMDQMKSLGLEVGPMP